MKKLLIILSLILTTNVFAATFYVSNAGNDAANGISTGTAWATLNKINSTILQPGDNILFERGSTFYGSLTVMQSGTSANPITFSAYGTGAKPVITGFTTVSNWTNLGGNIWESTNAVSTLATLNMVTTNGINTPMGRFPNSGFLTYKSHVGKTSITDNVGLTGYPNWTGAELTMFVATYTVDRNVITSQSGGTLYYQSPSDSSKEVIQSDGQRYIIQNDPRTLDAANEWYYNPSTKKIRIYSSISPTNVQVSTIDILAQCGDNYPFVEYITFDNIAFTGANTTAIQIRYSDAITVQNCILSLIGIDGIGAPFGYGSTEKLGGSVISNSFTNINGNAVNYTELMVGSQISDNTISNIGLLMGAGRSGGEQSIGIFAGGRNSQVGYNTISNIGYVGIYATKDSFTVNNNFVSNTLTLKTDGGAIYTSNGNTGRVDYGRKILNNIVISSPTARGIYIDDGSTGVEVAGNSVSACEYGIYLHGNKDIELHDNTIYNNMNSQLLIVAETNNEEVRRNNIHNNIFIAKEPSQLVMRFDSPYDDIAQFGTADSNYYSRPLNEANTFELYPSGSANTGIPLSSARNLTQWKTYSGQDTHSKSSPKVITDVSDIRFEYNATSSEKVITLDQKYIDIKGNSFNARVITLAPFKSAVLIKNGVLDQAAKWTRRIRSAFKEHD